MANKQKQFDIQFKKDAVKFCEDHPDMIHAECAANLCWKQHACSLEAGIQKQQ